MAAGEQHYRECKVERGHSRYQRHLEAEQFGQRSVDSPHRPVLSTIGERRVCVWCVCEVERGGNVADVLECGLHERCNSNPIRKDVGGYNFQDPSRNTTEHIQIHSSLTES